MKVIFFFDKMYWICFKFVKILFEYGVNVNVVDCEGKIVFMWVCICGEENIVCKILDFFFLDIDLNRGDKFGNMVLFYVVLSG